MTRCFGISVDGASKRCEPDLTGECECAAGTVTPCAAFATEDELAGGPSGDWGGETRPST